MNKPDIDSKEVLVLTHPLCCSQSCAANIDAKNIQVNRIKSDGSRLSLSGTGTSDRIMKSCQWCGKTYEQVKRIVPLHIDKIHCPKCNKSGKLEIDITDLKIVADRQYEFEANVVCYDCNKGNPLKNAIQKFVSNFSLSIGPSGISIKTK